MNKLFNIFSLIILTFSLFSCANKNANQKTNEIVIAKQIPLEDFLKILKNLVIRYLLTETFILSWLPTKTE